MEEQKVPEWERENVCALGYRTLMCHSKNIEKPTEQAQCLNIAKIDKSAIMEASAENEKPSLVNECEVEMATIKYTTTRENKEKLLAVASALGLDEDLFFQVITRLGLRRIGLISRLDCSGSSNY